jgi:oligopeptide/dipeptide ABC transporter ATP-binding protein
MPSVGCAPLAAEPLLEVRDLDVRISVESARPVSALAGISFRIAAGERVGLLGESGAGKTTLALALLRLLPPASRVTAGSIRFESRPLLSLGESELRKVRGARISIIYQDSMALNPVMRVGDQVAEVLRAHYNWTSRRCRDESRLLMEEMELEQIDRVYTSFPHQLSGGQRQRVLVAQALACRPSLVIADEPTASLDPGTASAIIELLGKLNQRFNTAFLIISHDISLLQRLTDRIMVIYAGRIIEQGFRQEILSHPKHPYTRALLECALPESRSGDLDPRRVLFPTIVGSPADRSGAALHCGFESRCPDRMEICGRAVPEETRVANAHSVACFKIGGQ